MTTYERFMAKVDVDPESGCWLWTGATKRGGYGAFRVGGLAVSAHRWSYEHHVGPIPGDLSVLHSCDTPACVNPVHLWVGTHADNVADMIAKGRQNRGAKGAAAVRKAQTHCLRGHPFDEANTNWRTNGTRQCRECVRTYRARLVSDDRGSGG